MSSDNQPQFVPYPGLRPFTGEEDYLFFGREEQVGELIESLQQHRFVAVVGSSGSGKSSLVRCGLLSEIQGGMMVDAGSEWEITVMQPGGDPLANLAQALIDAELYDEGDEVLHQVMATINRSTSGLVEAIKQSNIDASSNVLLVVDQFEEIFRFHDAGKDGEERAPDFIRRLIQAVKQDDVPLYVILTMRSDFLGDCSRFTGLAELINDGEYLVPKLKRDQLRQAIEGPARVAGGQVNRRLVQRLLNDIGEQADQLPILQHALMRTWDYALSRDDNATREMDIADYEAIGGMENALSTHADEVLQEVQDEHEDIETELFASRIFKALTEKGSDNRGIRRPTSLKELEAISSAPRDVVDAIINAYRAPGRTFLMPTVNTPLTDNTVIDISHESLMRVWQRLSDWVEDESQSVRIYQRLADTSALWKRGEAGLYRDPDLQIALGWMDKSKPNAAWAGRYDGSFETALDFLEESDSTQHAEEREAEATRQRELKQAQELAEAQELRAREQARATKRFRLLSGVVGVIAVFAVVASVMAYFAMQEAEQNELQAKQLLSQNEETQRELRETQTRDDIQQAQRLADNGDFYGAVRTLDQANTRMGGDADVLIELARHVSETNIWQTAPYPFGELSFSPNRMFESGEHLAVADEIGNLILGSIKNTSGHPVIKALFPAGVVDISVHETSVIVLLDDGSLMQYRSDADEQVSILAQLGEQNPEDGFPTSLTASQVTFSGNRCAIHDGNKLWILSLEPTPSVIASYIVDGEETSIIRSTFSDDHAAIFLVVDDDTYRVIDLIETPVQIRSLPVNSKVVFQEYLPLQKKLLAVEEAGLIQLVDIHDPLLDMVIDGGDVNQIKQFDISPDSTRLAMLSLSGDISVMSLANGDYFFRRQPDQNLRLTHMNFDSSGVYLVGVDFDSRLNALDSETGVSVVHPSDAKVHATYSPTMLQGQALERRSNSVLVANALETNPNAGTPAVVRWRIHKTTPVAAEFELDFAAIRESLKDVSKEELLRGANTITNFVISTTDDAAGATFFDPPVQGRAAAKFLVDWLFRRQMVFPNEFYDPESSQNYWANRTANGQSISLGQAMLASAVDRETLAAAINMPGEKGRIPAGNYSARYHHLVYLQSMLTHTVYPDLFLREAFSDDLLGHISQLDNLLEIRSMAYEDQTHEGEKIDLLDAEHIGYWDGLANRFNIEEGSISTPDLNLNGTWPSSENQYAIWRGAEFADFRISFSYQIPRGNSGLTIRGRTPDEAESVNNTSYLHPYLQQGYQSDFLSSSNSRGFFSVAGVLVNDNHLTDNRPLKIANRGQVALVRRDEEKVEFEREEFKSDPELIELLEHGEDYANMTVVSRGPRIDMFIEDTALNTAFDFHRLRHLSGMFSYQSLSTDTLLDISSISLTPLGRDIAEAEIHRKQDELSDVKLRSDLQFQRKQWKSLTTELTELIASDNSAPWAVDMLQTVGLNTRMTHRRLAKACMTNDVDVIQAIIDEVGDSNLFNDLAHSTIGDIGRGNFLPSPLMAALFDGNVEAVALLLENGVNVDQRVGGLQLAPAVASCIANQPETLKTLLDYGADPRAINKDDYSLLHEASKWSDPAVVQVLLDAGAELNHTDNLGWTALQDLARIRTFLGQRQRGGLGEYQVFALSERRLRMARFLISKGAEPDNVYGSTKTAIEIAEEAGDTEMVDLLKSLVK